VGLPFNPSSEEQPFNAAKKEVHDLLHDYPVVLFIDSLDQLSNEDSARKELSFLVGVQSHPDTRIIVSTLPDTRTRSSQSGYFYGCDTLLKAAGDLWEKCMMRLRAYFLLVL
jgi:hypothetical protein